MNKSETDPITPIPIRMWASRAFRGISLELLLILFLVTFMTASPLESMEPNLIRFIKMFGYLSVFIVIGFTLFVRDRSKHILTNFITSYPRPFQISLVVYFLGLVIGAMQGSSPISSIWQTFSDFVVFLFSFVLFGWLNADLNDYVRKFLRTIVLWTVIILLISLPLYIGNLNGWWSVNPYFHGKNGPLLMNGPFNHANHLAYVIMIGAFAAGAVTLLSKGSVDWKWLTLTLILTLGIVPTFGRGAMLGTATGLIGMLALRQRRLTFLLAFLAASTVVFFSLAPTLHIPIPKFIPKVESFRIKEWADALQNLKSYGPLGVGAGQAESRPGLSTHNFFLEQYGEGGVLTTIGVLGWLVLPIIHIKKSRLDRELAWSIVAMMAGVMVHGIFWTQFLNGLRYLTLVFVCLWTALATQKDPSPNQTSISVQPSG